MFNPFVTVVEGEFYTVVSPTLLGEFVYRLSAGKIVPWITFKRGFNLRQRLVIRGTLRIHFKDK